MKLRESETVELKRMVVDDVKKEVAAFANSSGGILYIGVDDDGSVSGVDDADAVIQQITNMVRDSIKPDVTMFVRYEIIDYHGRQIVAVTTQRGTNRPYYLAQKGMRPEGVYVRQGTSTVSATDTAIRQMIKETDGDSFEKTRSMEQALTFEQTGAEFRKRDIPFGPQQMQTLKLISKDGVYTNLALLLSEQCVHTIKAAVFQGTDQNIFKDRKEFGGSLIQQLNEAYRYIDVHNQIRSTFDGLIRIDALDYPRVAVREALLNALVHRDYSFRSSILISIFDDRIEFMSVGGLLPGIGLDDVMEGLSVCRNVDLANVFYRLKLIEAYGTGMPKIMGAYADAEKKPVIRVTTNAFKVILPNMNHQDDRLKNNFAERNLMDFSVTGGDENMIVEIVRQKGSVTRRDVEDQLAVSASTATRLLRYMTELGVLAQVGRARNTRYVLRDRA